MNVRLWLLTLTSCLAVTRDAPAALVRHEFSGVVWSSGINGVLPNDAFIAVLTYDTSQPDLEPADPNLGRYSEFTLSLDVGPISVIDINPALYGLAIIDGASGWPDQIIWYGAISYGNVGLSAYSEAGTAFASDVLPHSLSISDFDGAAITFLYPNVDEFRGTVISITSTVVPEPSCFAITGGAMAVYGFSFRPARRQRV